jgi:glycosyltransferase involved in cell wall biosynthesis
MKLSILILTIPERAHLLEGLLDRLRPQITGKPVEILLHRSATKSIGEKRNALLDMAKGKWVVYIDDDDLVSRDYVDKILSALRTNPDCVGISGIIVTRGRERQWHISLNHPGWFETDKVYYRSPNHISPVRRSLALQARFPETNHGEDAEYSRRLIGLLKTEVKVEGNIYTYRYRK